jgi:hypothetical protein
LLKLVVHTVTIPPCFKGLMLMRDYYAVKNRIRLILKAFHVNISFEFSYGKDFV